MFSFSLAVRNLIFVSLFYSSSIVRAQEKIVDTNSSSTASVAVASLLPASLVGSALILNYEAFWKSARYVPFHISNDPPYSMHIDKFAHFQLSSAMSDGVRAAYRLAGVSSVTSAWLGAGLSFATGMVIEMEDARHGDDPQYGFSPGDAAADLVGASLPLLKHYYPFFRRVDAKLSLWPSDALKQHAYKTIADDYESQYFWLSWDVHDVLSSPSLLNLAIGFSCENLNSVNWLPSRRNTQPATDIFIGPDINLKGISIEGKFWEVFTSIMQYIRIPLPALQVYPRVKVWGLR